MAQWTFCSSISSIILKPRIRTVRLRDGPAVANVGTFRSSFIQERIAYLIYNFGSHFYSFEGLREYKTKYAANWSPRYILYSRDSWIGYVMIALLIVDNRTITASSL